jgi:hypothetical protein
MLETKRRVIGHLIVCQGCCCRERGKDRPALVEWLKEEWRLETFPNVVVVNSESGSQWLANVTESTSTVL